MDFCHLLVEAWSKFEKTGHPMEVGHAFVEQHLDQLLFETLPKLLEEAVAKDQAATEV